MNTRIAVFALLVTVGIVTFLIFRVTDFTDGSSFAVTQTASDESDDESVQEIDQEQPTDGLPFSIQASEQRERVLRMPGDRSAASESRETAPQAGSNLPMGFTQDPEMHLRIIEFLVESGLAAADAERMADAALAELKGCAEDAFNPQTRAFDETVLQTCMLNVLSEYGLPVDDPTVRTTIGIPRSE